LAKEIPLEVREQISICIESRPGSNPNVNLAIISRYYRNNKMPYFGVIFKDMTADIIL
jgi:hypothetical protein